jgi:hypothetical protein
MSAILNENTWTGNGVVTHKTVIEPPAYARVEKCPRCGGRWGRDGFPSFGEIRDGRRKGWCWKCVAADAQGTRREVVQAGARMGGVVTPSASSVVAASDEVKPVTVTKRAKPQKKTCGVCREEKPVSAFYRHSRDGYQSRCKECQKAIARAGYAKITKRTAEPIPPPIPAMACALPAQEPQINRSLWSRVRGWFGGAA